MALPNRGEMRIDQRSQPIRLREEITLHPLPARIACKLKLMIRMIRSNAATKF
jgi:hypothetical protein